MVHRQVTSYLSTSKLYPPFQSAYRSQHSTKTALVKVFSDIVDALDDGNIAILTTQFNSGVRYGRPPNSSSETAAFNWHLRNGASLRWFESYVIGRTQSAHLSNDTTPPGPSVCDVPQGSVLGPLPFLLYTADIGSIIAAHGLLHHCYADDTQIYFFCRASNSASRKDRVLSCIDDIA